MIQPGQMNLPQDLQIIFTGRGISLFCIPSTRWEWDYFPSDSPNVYLYDVDRVTEGDTVQFTYFSDWVASQDTFTYPVYSATEIIVDSQLVGWDIYFGNYDLCMGEFDNVLFISVGISNEYELEIIRDVPPPYLDDKFISEYPSMPEVILKAKMNNYNNGIVKYRWAYWVTSDFPRRNKNSSGNYYDIFVIG